MQRPPNAVNFDMEEVEVRIHLTDLATVNVTNQIIYPITTFWINSFHVDGGGASLHLSKGFL